MVLSQSQLCSMQTRCPSQAAVRCCCPWLACAMRDLCLGGHCGKAEALLQSSAHAMAAPCPCQGSEAPQEPGFCSISSGGTHLGLLCLCSAAWGNRCFQEKGVQGWVSEGNVRWPMEIPCSCRALSRQGTGGAFLSLLSQGLLM